MGNGAERRGAGLIDSREVERVPEIVVVPPGLHALRVIVLGASALIGAIGLVVFVQVPNPVRRPADAAAAGARASDPATGAGCGTACRGRASILRPVDLLPAGLDTHVLDEVARAEPDGPMAATPPSTGGHHPEAGGDERDRRSTGKGNASKRPRQDSNLRPRH